MESSGPFHIRSRDDLCQPPRLSHISNRLLLVWAKQFSFPFSLLSLNVVREVGAFLAYRPVLMKAFPDGIFMFDADKMRVWKVDFDLAQLPVHHSIPGESICIGDCQVFVCGGYSRNCSLESSMKTAYLWANGCGYRLPNMYNRRLLHALYFDPALQAVFAFGGMDVQAGSSKHCEVYGFQKQSWTTLPDMITARQGFNTCGDKGKVYLCGGGVCTCEVFTIATAQFALIPNLTFPHLPLCTALWDSDLLVFDAFGSRRWELQSGIMREEKEGVISANPLGMLATGGFVYLIEDQCTVVCISLESREVCTRIYRDFASTTYPQS